MSTIQTAPYGSWRSPITADLIVAGAVGLGQIAVDGETIFWVESRPSESGRNVIVRRSPDGRTDDVTPASFNVRTRVHEYGGGAYAVADGTVVFSNFSDGRLYRQDGDGAPRPITPEGELLFADLVFDRQRDRLICVREDHTKAGTEATNSLVAVDLAGDDAGGTILVSGNDFYASPRLSPDGSQLAWLTWNHPQMPWDGTEVWCAENTADGSLGAATAIAGSTTESIFQPAWSPDGVLHFVSDRTGWWNLYRCRDGEIEPLCPMEAEFGEPQWVFGQSTYAFLGQDQIVCAYTQAGRWHLARLDTASGKLTPVETASSDIEGVRSVGTTALFLGGSPTTGPAIVQYDVSTGEETVLRRGSETEIAPRYLSPATAITFPTENGLTAHAFHYPPQNQDYVAPADERPPLIVQSHGGPTGATSTTLNLSIQFWTSRGFAVLDVNYGGSTGYGRAYRERLDDQWGIVDVDDCVNGARYLVADGAADPERLAIRGRSASGYTTLAALTFRDLFRAGASHFGISDLETMARDTHKFESRYLDGLLGPYPARRDIYVERSPIHAVERLSAPLILFQGLEDKVVPPDQAETMFEAVRAKGLPVAYVPFAGEQHGFRRAENIVRALEAELYFYSRVFGFETADAIEPVDIANLPPSS